MRYLELILYAFAKFVIWYSVVLLFGIVAVEVATCPAQNRFVKSERSGATYVCDRNGDIARSNAVLREHLHQGRGADETRRRDWELSWCGGPAPQVSLTVLRDFSPVQTNPDGAFSCPGGLDVTLIQERNNPR
jgi:hypothetical protein